MEAWVELFDEAAAERVARIIGHHSAASMALAELKRRRSIGEEVALFTIGSTFVVGPLPFPPEDRAE